MPNSPGLFTLAPAGLSLSATILATQSSLLKGYWKCDEPSGTTLADSSGNANNMAIQGTINTNYWLGEAGDNGTCFRSDGSVGWAKRSMILTNGTNHEYTFFCLINGGTDLGNGVAMCNSHDGSNNAYAYLTRNTGAEGETTYQSDGGTNVQIHGGTAFDNTWHSLLGRRIGNTFELFVDGVSVGTPVTNAVSITLANITSLLGIQIAAGTFIAKASIQHAAMWDVGLSDSEITAIDAAR